VATQSATAASGNGAPSGTHYNLNLIGLENQKTAKTDISGYTGSSGHRIFVPLYGNCKICLVEKPTFCVLDYDGTDGQASFGLPDPYPYDPYTAEYSIYVKTGGKPGGDGKITTGFYDPETGEYYTSVYSVSLSRGKGKSSFTDVTKQLTTIYVDMTDDGFYNPVRVNLFVDRYEDYFWSYDNNGLKVIQLRFYPIPVYTGDNPV
jgi:hypothetical protein